MALFGKDKETKEEKQLRLQQEMLEKHHLTELPADLSDDVAAIVKDLTGMEAVELGVVAKGGANLLSVSYQKALIAQNWIIIRLLNKIYLDK